MYPVPTIDSALLAELKSGLSTTDTIYPNWVGRWCTATRDSSYQALSDTIHLLTGRRALETLDTNNPRFQNCRPLLCFYPTKVYNRSLGREITVPCGSCIACKSTPPPVSLELNFRFALEADASINTCFLTLTLSDSFLEPIVARDISLLTKKLRKIGYKFKYAAALELGPRTFRPHVHMVIFEHERPADYPPIEHTIEEYWPFGHVDMEAFDANSTPYLLRYEKKITPLESQYLCSKRPAIGYPHIIPYAESYADSLISHSKQRKRMSLPTYKSMPYKINRQTLFDLFPTRRDEITYALNIQYTLYERDTSNIPPDISFRYIYSKTLDNIGLRYNAMAKKMTVEAEY